MKSLRPNRSSLTLLVTTIAVVLVPAPAHADLGWGTPVATRQDGIVQQIETLNVGDPVLVGDGGNSWRMSTVDSTDRQGDGHQSIAALYVHYAIGGNDHAAIIVTPDQLFVTSEHTLVRADRLLAGQNLLAADGASVPILAVEIGMFSRGIHGISAAGPLTPGSPDGHILNANGIQVSDFLLQLNPPKDPRERPLFNHLDDRLVAADGAADVTLDAPAEQPDATPTEAPDAPAAEVQATAQPDATPTVAPANPAADDQTTAEPEAQSPASDQPTPDPRILPIGDVRPDLRGILSLSTPAPASHKKLGAYMDCLLQKTTEYEQAHPGTRWPNSPVDVCRQHRSFRVTGTAKVDADGHVHLSMVCPAGYRVTDIVARATGRTGEVKSVRLLQRAVHIGTTTARANSSLHATARCALVR